MGNYIELGLFQSVRSRAGTKWSRTLRHKRKETQITSQMQNTYIKPTAGQRSSKQTAEEIVTKVKIFIKDGIDRANKEIPIECLDERNK